MPFGPRRGSGPPRQLFRHDARHAVCRMWKRNGTWRRRALVPTSTAVPPSFTRARVFLLVGVVSVLGLIMGVSWTVVRNDPASSDSDPSRGVAVRGRSAGGQRSARRPACGCSGPTCGAADRGQDGGAGGATIEPIAPVRAASQVQPSAPATPSAPAAPSDARHTADNRRAAGAGGGLDACAPDERGPAARSPAAGGGSVATPTTSPPVPAAVRRLPRPPPRHTGGRRPGICAGRAHQWRARRRRPRQGRCRAGAIDRDEKSRSDNDRATAGQRRVEQAGRADRGRVKELLAKAQGGEGGWRQGLARGRRRQGLGRTGGASRAGSKWS